MKIGTTLSVMFLLQIMCSNTVHAACRVSQSTFQSFGSIVTSVPADVGGDDEGEDESASEGEDESASEGEDGDETMQCGARLFFTVSCGDISLDFVLELLPYGKERGLFEPAPFQTEEMPDINHRWFTYLVYEEESYGVTEISSKGCNKLIDSETLATILTFVGFENVATLQVCWDTEVEASDSLWAHSLFPSGTITFSSEDFEEKISLPDGGFGCGRVIPIIITVGVSAAILMVVLCLCFACRNAATGGVSV